MLNCVHQGCFGIHNNFNKIISLFFFFFFLPKKRCECGSGVSGGGVLELMSNYVYCALLRLSSHL